MKSTQLMNDLASLEDKSTMASKVLCLSNLKRCVTSNAASRHRCNQGERLLRMEFLNGKGDDMWLIIYDSCQIHEASSLCNWPQHRIY